MTAPICRHGRLTFVGLPFNKFGTRVAITTTAAAFAG
jgi:hypothetical protein